MAKKTTVFGPKEKVLGKSKPAKNKKSMAGRVIFFNPIKGWGIIGTKDENFFVHHSYITDKRFFPKDKIEKFRALKEKQMVCFIPEVQKGKKLRAAREVEIIDAV